MVQVVPVLITDHSVAYLPIGIYERTFQQGGAAGGAEALIVDRCAHHQEVAAGETSHPALITYTNLIDSDHMGNLSPPTPGHWRYPNNKL